MLLEHQQQWNVTCDAEADSGNSSFLNVCAAVETSLHILTQHMIDYVSGSYFKPAYIIRRISFNSWRLRNVVV